MHLAMKIALVALGLGLALWILRARVRRSRARTRLAEPVDQDRFEPAEAERSSLAAWLSRAGLRGRGAPAAFLWSQVGAGLIAALVAGAVAMSPLVPLGREALLAIPGDGGRLLEPVLLFSPVVLFVLIVAWPWVHVRRLQLKRLRTIEQDLPLMLELMASLAQSGLGFDAALGRLVATQDPSRPLITDLQAFRRDILSGFPRLETYQRLGTRAATPGVDTLVAALIHAEQLGASIATTLRNQADEAWNERKERLLARSQSLPTRLAAPLVVCFLPGLLVVTLAPALVRFSELVTGVLDGNN